MLLKQESLQSKAANHREPERKSCNILASADGDSFRRSRMRQLKKSAEIGRIQYTQNCLSRRTQIQHAQISHLVCLAISDTLNFFSVTTWNHTNINTHSSTTMGFLSKNTQTIHRPRLHPLASHQSHGHHYFHDGESNSTNTRSRQRDYT